MGKGIFTHYIFFIVFGTCIADRHMWRAHFSFAKHTWLMLLVVCCCHCYFENEPESSWDILQNHID